MAKRKRDKETLTMADITLHRILKTEHWDILLWGGEGGGGDVNVIVFNL